MKPIKSILSVVLSMTVITVTADSGVPGLREGLLLVGVAVSLSFILVNLAVALLISWLFNTMTGEKRSHIWLIFLIALLFSSIAFFVHGVGDLSFSSGYILFMLACSFVGASIGYVLTRKKALPIL